MNQSEKNNNPDLSNKITQAFFSVLDNDSEGWGWRNNSKLPKHESKMQCL